MGLMFSIITANFSEVLEVLISPKTQTLFLLGGTLPKNFNLFSSSIFSFSIFQITFSLFITGALTLPFVPLHLYLHFSSSFFKYDKEKYIFLCVIYILTIFLMITSVLLLFPLIFYYSLPYSAPSQILFYLDLTSFIIYLLVYIALISILEIFSILFAYTFPSEFIYLFRKPLLFIILSIPLFLPSPLTINTVLTFIILFIYLEIKIIINILIKNIMKR